VLQLLEAALDAEENPERDSNEEQQGQAKDPKENEPPHELVRHQEGASHVAGMPYPYFLIHGLLPIRGSIRPQFFAATPLGNTLVIGKCGNWVKPSRSRLLVRSLFEESIRPTKKNQARGEGCLTGEGNQIMFGA
jgi:hypothetical protein